MDAQHDVIAYWNALGGAVYDADPGHAVADDESHRIWLDALRALLPAPSADILDVGTGTGVLAFLMAELGHRVTGTDLAEGMLATARAKIEPVEPMPTFLLGDAVAPAFRTGSFDIVTSRHLIWTLTDPALAFRNWFALLRPGGRVLAIDGLWWQTGALTPGPEQDDPLTQSFRRHYRPEVFAALPLARLKTDAPIAALATAAGFADVRFDRRPDLDAMMRTALSPALRERFAPLAVLVGEKPSLST